MASWQSETNNYSTLRDASFSSYLNKSEEIYVRNLVNNTTLHHSLDKKVEDDEIDVFSAYKYFNEEVLLGRESNNTSKPTKLDHQFIKRRDEEETDLINLSKLNLQPRTPSGYSESSWNSRSTLLRPLQRNSSRSKSNIKVKKSSFLPLCYYCCNDKSIEIDFLDQLSTENSSYKRENDITRTIQTSFNTADIARLNKLRPDPFTFQVSAPGVQVLTPGGAYLKEEDNESDASSDLFEIECVPYHPTGPGGGCGTLNTMRYEPSEVSVDWSVVTASATLDYSEDQKSTLNSMTSGGLVGPKSGSRVDKVANKGGQKARFVGSLLGGCRTRKAVRVAEDVYV